MTWIYMYSLDKLREYKHHYNSLEKMTELHILYLYTNDVTRMFFKGYHIWRQLI